MVSGVELVILSNKSEKYNDCSHRIGISRLPTKFVYLVELKVTLVPARRMLYTGLDPIQPSASYVTSAGDLGWDASAAIERRPPATIADLTNGKSMKRRLISKFCHGFWCL